MRPDTLRTSGVSCAFAGIHALRDVSLEIQRHEVVGLIGPNGAGKTTLVNVISGFQRPSKGSVYLGPQDITHWRPERRGRVGVARTFQHSRSFRRLTVRENIEVAALGSGVSRREARQRAGALLEMLGLRAQAGAVASSLAHGDERKLGVARAAATSPSYILLDEPAAGLPESEVPEFAAAVRTLRSEQDAGILLIDHNMALIMELCDRIHVLDEGRTLAEGTANEIRSNVDVTAAYLGEQPMSDGGD